MDTSGALFDWTQWSGAEPQRASGPVARFWRLKPDTFRRSLEARFRGDLRYSEQTQFETLAEQVVEDAQRASDIITRIRGMAMKRDPDLQPLSLGEIVEEALQIVRHEPIDRSLRLSTDLAPGLPPVLGDRILLQQVIVNLVVGAVQAMAGSPDAALSICTVREEHGGTIRAQNGAPAACFTVRLPAAS